MNLNVIFYFKKLNLGTLYFYSRHKRFLSDFFLNDKYPDKILVNSLSIEIVSNCNYGQINIYIPDLEV